MKLKANKLAKGDCFVVAFNLVMDAFNGKEYVGRDIKLVHGIVIGQGELEGLSYPHAWVEVDGEVVVDRANGRDITLPVLVYYAIGGIHGTFKYTADEARKKVLKFKNYGTWDFTTVEHEMALRLSTIMEAWLTGVKPLLKELGGFTESVASVTPSMRARKFGKRVAKITERFEKVILNHELGQEKGKEGNGEIS